MQRSLIFRRFFCSIRPSRSECTPQRAAEYLATKGGEGAVSFEEYGADFPGVGAITFDNVAKKNGLTGKMMAQFNAIVHQLTKDQAKFSIIVLRGAGGTFCSGGDLQFVKEIANSEDGYLMCTLMGDTLARLSALPIVSIAKIDGFALGGGSELAASADIRACHEAAKVGFVQGRLGVSPGWGGTSFVLRALGYSRAIEALATASVMKADRLLEIGFAQHIFKNDEDFDAYLKTFATINPVPLKAMKQSIYALSKRNFEAFWEERRIFASLWGGPLQLEALNSNKKHK